MFVRIASMGFNPANYSAAVQSILSLEGDGKRAMPLAKGTANPAGIHAIAKLDIGDLFPEAFSPQAAVSGLYLYFCGYDQAHTIAQDLATIEGSFWHGILHRQEPDAENAAYWFRRVNQHPVFPLLKDRAEQLGLPVKNQWDPFRFIDFCEAARQKPGSEDEQLAKAVQLAEWQLLFDYCARKKS
ncbi:MAG TPA: hypothetical protein VEX68_18595 [Bryobacteraceae bacterium]|nr:hypothetical protein [Bryobacteraceae bacterium]